jgi:hypothetical protein
MICEYSEMEEEDRAKIIVARYFTQFNELSQESVQVGLPQLFKV